jgi:acyl carrier protein
MDQTAKMPDQSFIAMVRSHLKYLKPSDQLGLDQPLKTLGLDSMAAVDLLLDIEDNYAITLPDTYLTEETFSTIQALWLVIDHLTGSLEIKG